MSFQRVNVNILVGMRHSWLGVVKLDWFIFAYYLNVYRHVICKVLVLFYSFFLAKIACNF